MRDEVKVRVWRFMCVFGFYIRGNEKLFKVFKRKNNRIMFNLDRLY